MESQQILAAIAIAIAIGLAGCDKLPCGAEASAQKMCEAVGDVTQGPRAEWFSEPAKEKIFNSLCNSDQQKLYSAASSATGADFGALMLNGLRESTEDLEWTCPPFEFWLAEMDAKPAGSPSADGGPVGKPSAARSQ